MRHIPEDELHAYLDQGLSRSQCVEIESHLAGCASCQAERDGIAALRDRTTALLSRLSPQRSFPAPLETLRRRAAVELSARRRRVQRASWAASIVAAVAFGWTANQLAERAPLSRSAEQPLAASTAASRRVPVDPIATSSAADNSSVANNPSASPVHTEPAPRSTKRVRTVRQASRASEPAVETTRVSIPPVIAPAELELSQIDTPSSAGFELDGMWRTMSWAGAQEEAGDKLPHIDGLPIVQVQVQAGTQGRQPLMVVAQQLSSGQVIRTIEGPTSDVSHLLSRRAMSDPEPGVSSVDTSRSSNEPYRGVDGTMAMQRGDRMIAITGALPQDSLLAMIRRLNVEMRSK